MQIVVAATDDQWDELTGNRLNINWQRVDSVQEFVNHLNADAYFSLIPGSISEGFQNLDKPVFINSVILTTSEIKAPPHVYRINGWPGFLSRKVWEYAGTSPDNMLFIPEIPGIKLIKVADEPGFITARTLAMIINEAYFALEEKVSSKSEIDTAMKLGTNYPFGPFEWALKIGTANILALLQKLFETDSRYKPATLLKQEVEANS